MVDAFAARHADRFAFSTPPASAAFGFFESRTRGGFQAAAERAIETERVLVAPGEFFGDVAGFRLSWAKPREALAEGLARLDRALAR